MDQEFYALTDLQGYAKQLRYAVGESISKNNQENLDDYISIGQIINLVNDHCLGYDEMNRPILDEETNEDIFQEVLSWFHNIALSKLASKGLIECAWDDDKQEMIFWAPNKATDDAAKNH